MKYCHLVAALALAACGLNTSALPSTGHSSDAGVSSAASQEDQSIAGSALTWPIRPRPAKRNRDSGSDDTKDAASKPAQPSRGGASGSRDAQTDPNNQGGHTIPGSASNPSGQPSSPGGSAKPGTDQAQPSGSNSGRGNSGSGSSSSNGSGTQADAGTPNAGWSTPNDPDDDDPDSDESADEADHGSNSGQSSGSNGGQSSGSNSGQSSGSSGNGSQQPNNNDAVSSIVDLVIAILDLSLGPIRPAEIEALVSSILVLSLAPAELAAESLVAVLDALEDTRICVDRPERCNSLCTNLESDCSACGRDEDCIERIEEMCQVKLPKTCL